MQHNTAVFLVTGLTHHKGHRAAGEITVEEAAVGVLAVPVMAAVVGQFILDWYLTAMADMAEAVTPRLEQTKN